jgi:hypothetical protein
MSHHAHDSEESARPFIFNEVIPICQWRSVTQHVGRKSAKELLSLAPFFFYVPFDRFCKYGHRPKVLQCRWKSPAIT